MMNPEVKQQWITDLRSGRFKQGMNMLRTTDDHYCCLGVLGCRFPTGDWIPSVSGWSLKDETETTYSYLPHGIRVWAGLTVDDEGSLSQMNDQGFTFEEIADYIEKRF